MAGGTLSDDVRQRQEQSARSPGKRVGVSVVVGSAVEWFDFYLYASMAALVFNKVFFPSGNAMAGTMASVATFAVGFLARPVGGILFGALGDRIGRNRVLSLTFLLMGISSGCIGLLPGYADIGIAAPVLLVVLRLLQGLGAGAEFGGAIALAYEHADPARRGRQGAWPALGVNIGLLASSLTVTVLTSTSDGFLYGFGWRIPFLLSFALVGIGFWMRRRVPETPEFERAVREARRVRKRRSPLLELVRSDWRGLAVVMAVTAGYNGVSYVFKTFSLAYLTSFRDVAASVGSMGISIASACAIVTAPLAGRLADRVGAKSLVITGAVATGLLAFPFFWLLDTGNHWLIWLDLTLATGIVVPLMLAAQGAFLAKQFPTRVRTSGLGTGREVSGALSGGLAPLAALGIVQAAPGHATWGVSLLFVAGALFIGVGAACDQSRRHGPDLN
ncbi:MFS transporter [Streptomyces albiaxialis]|uniref:MFS transporter n=1 Tax=Streptomyces albiaxialis TaxID=329523 RepID=A0ABN2WLH5_9ACTN